jgi:hypothetical protein
LQLEGAAIATRPQHLPPAVDSSSPQAGRTAVQPSPDAHKALQSWKEIASELNRGIRTVQRWERTLGLPVRRVGKGPRCPVIAFRDELHQWLRTKAQECGRTERQKEVAIAAEPKFKAGLLQSIEDFFASDRSTRVKETCSRCHSPMQFLKGDFWIYGTGTKWSKSVPFCPVCEAENLEVFRRNPILQ